MKARETEEGAQGVGGGLTDGVDFALEGGKFLIGAGDFFSELLRVLRYWFHERIDFEFVADRITRGMRGAICF